MNLSNLIKTKRKEKNMTMAELASFLGVSEGTVSRLESGKIQKIRIDKAPLLAKYLEIPLELILSGKSIDGLNNKINALNTNNKKMEESISFLNTNFNNCNFKDYAVGQVVNVGLKNKEIIDIINQLTDEGKEEILNYANYLLGKYKK